MILAGARLAVDGASAQPANIQIVDGKIRYAARKEEEAFDAAGLLLLPGLINAHDHLEFSLFPRLTRRIYGNCAEWARDIYLPDESPVKEHRAVAFPTRLMWGGIRNLLSGVTTVAHHNPYDPAFDSCFPVRVVKEFSWAHSLTFSPDLQERFRNTPAGWPFIVHAAEGSDEQARSEIDRLEELGVLAPHTVLVHANAVHKKEITLLRRYGTSVIWCPQSNLSTYGHTLSPEDLQSGLRFALGTDSAITSHGDMIDELHTAIVDCGVDAATVYRMVTSDAAAVLRLGEGQGSLSDGSVADIVAVADYGQSPSEALLDLKPEFVMVGGRFKMMSRRIAARKGGSALSAGFQPIRIASRDTCLIDADVESLHREAVCAVGSDLRLSGRDLCVGVAA